MASSMLLLVTTMLMLLLLLLLLVHGLEDEFKWNTTTRASLPAKWVELESARASPAKVEGLAASPKWACSRPSLWILWIKAAVILAALFGVLKDVVGAVDLDHLGLGGLTFLR